MTKRVLLVAFHYPPYSRSSGVHRTRKFAQYLPEFGWEPIVLSAHPRAYEESDKAAYTDPAGAIVKRAFVLDTARHLSIAGRYPKMLAFPDRWCSWWLGAVPAGLALIRRYRPDVIWSTYPIATAHLIGLTLHKLTGLPWVADFRDPMTDDGYPRDRSVKRIYQWIETRAVLNSQCSVFTTPDSQRMYARRFPGIPENRWKFIPNGYDEDAFAEAEKLPLHGTRINTAVNRPYVLVHSGILYPLERDPEPFFAALADLRNSGNISGRSLKVVLRAPGNDGHYQKRLNELGIADIVVLAPSTPYRDALAEMLSADGLLLLQAANCNHQIPAKAYEYLRAQRPVFALTDHRGNTANLLRQSGIDTIVDIASKEQIKTGLLRFLDLLTRAEAPVATPEAVATHSRRAGAGELAQLLNRVAGENSSP